MRLRFDYCRGLYSKKEYKSPLFGRVQRDRRLDTSCSAETNFWDHPKLIAPARHTEGRPAHEGAGLRCPIPNSWAQHVSPPAFGPLFISHILIEQTVRLIVLLVVVEHGIELSSNRAPRMVACLPF